LNRYSYALNNPIIYRDPTGHQVMYEKNPWMSPGPVFENHHCPGPGANCSPSVAGRMVNTARDPEFWIGMIPVYGDARSSYKYFQTGHPILGTIYGASAVLDLTGIYAIGKGVVKGVGKGVVKKVLVKEVVEEVGEKAVKETTEEVGERVVKEGTEELLEGASKTPTDLHAFGNKTQPRPVRPDRDFGVSDMTDVVGPESPPLPNGASTYADVGEAPLTGQYHRIPEGTALPDGLDVVADGADVLPNSPHPRTHHTIYPNQSMTVEKFNDKFLSLPWEHAGKKK
jgi:hypothetical protein